MPTVELRRLGDFFSTTAKKKDPRKKIKKFCSTIGFVETMEGAFKTSLQLVSTDNPYKSSSKFQMPHYSLLSL
jgi:hypothetical protein